jgi:hypothetical protein
MLPYSAAAYLTQYDHEERRASHEDRAERGFVTDFDQHAGLIRSRCWFVMCWGNPNRPSQTAGFRQVEVHHGRPDD